MPLLSGIHSLTPLVKMLTYVITLYKKQSLNFFAQFKSSSTAEINIIRQLHLPRLAPLLFCPSLPQSFQLGNPFRPQPFIRMDSVEIALFQAVVTNLQQLFFKPPDSCFPGLFSPLPFLLRRLPLSI